jgi:hypothetical protein
MSYCAKSDYVCERNAVKVTFGRNIYTSMKTLITLFICLQTLVVFSQNLVPNGSFEEYEMCPEVLDLTGTVSSWYNVLNSCDYFNECSEFVGVPDNPQSYQAAFDGSAYCGLHTYFLVDPNYREVLGIRLFENLEVGSQYFFSFRINKADKSENIKATNNLGIKFSLDSIQGEDDLINNAAHFKIDTICYDSENWSLITGSFISDSEYQFLFIGNFFTDWNTQTDGPGTVWDRNGYYNIDEVRLSTDQNYAWPVSTFDVQFEKPSLIYNSVIAQLYWSNMNDHGTLDIYDAVGRKIKCISIDMQTGLLDMKELRGGAYIGILNQVNGNISTFKFIKT